MADKKANEIMDQLMAKMGPEALRCMKEILNNSSAPINARIQLVNMILERTMGKPEETMRLLMEQEDREAAERRIAEIVRLAQGKPEA